MRDVEKILIIRFSSIGDIVLASPLIRALRSAYPTSQIDFLVKKEYAELVQFNPHLTSVIVLTSSEKEEIKALKATIRNIHYDLLIDLHHSLRSFYIRLFSGVRHVRTVNKRVIARFFLVNFKWNFYRNVVSVADRYLKTVEQLGVRDDGKGLELFIPEETTSSMDAIMSKYKLDRYETILGIAPMANHATKRWLPERFVEFGVRSSKNHRTKIFIFGNHKESDFCGDIAQLINTQTGSAIAESLAGKLSLLETAAAIDFCDLVVSNDTGIMHLAAARKKKVVAIFGSTVREFGFYPYGTDSIVLEQSGLPCRPCSHIGRERCPKGHFRCMKDILADDVIEATKRLLMTQTG
ncbi:MAG: glycosyltransferase family 9 protein [Ignavibacteriae bacterium]|nr:glycosyltransferase family 9 protein [Ignavibacteriota bacterium]